MSARSIVEHALTVYYHVPEVDGDDVSRAQDVASTILEYMLLETPYTQALVEQIRAEFEYCDDPNGSGECCGVAKVVKFLSAITEGGSSNG